DPDALAAPDFHDLTGARDPVAAALKMMARDHDSPLDLLADRLTAAAIFRVGPDRHLLYLRSHHIVLDGVGAAAVLRRTGERYAANVGGEPETGAKTSGIAAVLMEENAYIGSDRARTDRAYWQD